MKINIASVLKNEGGSLNVSGEIPSGTLNYMGNGFEFDSPFLLEGVLKNMGGVLELTGSIKGEYKSNCDCCGASVKGSVDAKIDERINVECDEDSPEEGYDRECFSLSGTVLDISGLINALVWGSLPMKVLCREDCKGLCSVCGCNLNETVCNCDTEVYDPRLAILREWAKK